MKKIGNVPLIVVGLLVLLVGAVYVWQVPPSAGPHDEFAQCLEKRGAIFYGAFWCSHCNEQKALFGESAKKLPYTECSTQDKKAQLAICEEENITGYPTWEFADGSREVGVLSFEKLSKKTGCEFRE